MIRDSVNNVNELLAAPRNALDGKYTPDQMKGVGQRMAFTLAGLGLGAPSVEGEVARTFGGVMAKTADKQALAKAQSMEASTQHSPQDIWNSTGWFRGPDSKWRFEIPDSGASIAPDHLQPESGKVDLSYAQQQSQDRNAGKLPSLLDHPELYQAYPSLRNTTVGFENSSSALGAFTPGRGGRIDLSRMPESDALSTTLHETQHGIQDIEKFAQGGSPDDFLPPGWHNAYATTQQRFQDLAKKITASGANPTMVQAGLTRDSLGLPLGNTQQHLATVINHDPDLLSDFQGTMTDLAEMGLQRKAARDSYMSLSGEVEARNVQERHATGDYSTFPLETEVVPTGKQIVKMPGGGSLLGTQVDHDPFLQVSPIEHDPFLHSTQPVDHDPFQVETQNASGQ